MASSWAATAPALEEEEQEEEEEDINIKVNHINAAEEDINIKVNHINTVEEVEEEEDIKIKVSHINTGIKEKRQENEIIDVKINQLTNSEIKVQGEESENMKKIHNNFKIKEHLERDIKQNSSLINTNVEINKEKTTNVMDNDIMKMQRIGRTEREEKFRSERNERADCRSSGGYLATRGNSGVFRDKGIPQDCYLKGRMRTTVQNVEDEKSESSNYKERRETSSLRAKGRQEKRLRSQTGSEGESYVNGFSTGQDETGYKETKETVERVDMKENEVWSDSQIAQGRISRGANIQANFEANGTKNISKDETQSHGSVVQMDKQTNTDSTFLREHTSVNKLDNVRQTNIRWFDKVQQSDETKSEDLSSRYKVGHDRGEILQKWEEITGHQETMRVEKQVGNKEDSGWTNAHQAERQEDEERLNEDKIWKSESERGREKTLHSWEMISNLRESLEQKGTRQTNGLVDEVESGRFQRSGDMSKLSNLKDSLEEKGMQQKNGLVDEIESGRFQRAGTPNEGHRAQGVKRDYVLI